MSSIYEFKANDIKGKPFDMASLKGKVLLIFNSASECGFTPQLKGFEKLHQQYSDKGLAVIGFPSADFKQEKGTNEEIVEFCTRNFGVTFQMMDTIHVNGDDAHPLFEFLKEKKKSLFLKRVKWNFEKWIVDRNGTVVSRHASTTTPESLEEEIKSLL